MAGNANPQGTFPRKLAKATAIAIVGGVAGFILKAYGDFIEAWVEARLLHLDGPITGKYVILLGGYDHNPPYLPTTYELQTELWQAGTAVFGTEAHETDTWRLRGYKRDQFLAIAYENYSPRSIGTGAYSLQRSLKFAFSGSWAGVECKGGLPVLLRCPAILYPVDHPEIRDRSLDFVKRECELVPIDVLERTPQPPTCH